MVVICRGLVQIPAGIFGSTRQRSEVKVKLHSNDHNMSGWPEVVMCVCVCVCVCVHMLLIFHFCVHFSLFNVCYQHILICQLLYTV